MLAFWCWHAENFLLTKNRRMKKQLEPARRGLSRIRETPCSCLTGAEHFQKTETGSGEQRNLGVYCRGGRGGGCTYPTQADADSLPGNGE